MTASIANTRSAPTGVTRVDPLTIPQILALPAIVPAWPTASAALGGSAAGLGRRLTYALCKSGDYPVPVIAQGGRKNLVRRVDILSRLGLNDDATGIALPVAPVEPTSASTATQQ